jgi:hypothetical protein
MRGRYLSRFRQALLGRTHRDRWKDGLRHLARVMRGQSPTPEAEAALAYELLDEAHREWEATPATRRSPNSLSNMITRAGQTKWIAQAAMESGGLERAAQLAREVLRLEEQIRDHDPRRVHDGSYEHHLAHIILGGVALRQQSIEEAKAHLLAAVKVRKQGAVLESYGPDFALAGTLLQQGHVQDVETYLESCREIWPLGRGLIDSWLAEMRLGGKPHLDKSPWLRSRRLRDVISSLR